MMILYSSADGHLLQFFILTLVNNDTKKVEQRYLFKILILFPSDIYPNVGLLDHMVFLF